MDYRKSHLHPEKGATYHAEFTKNPYRSMVWTFEKKVFQKILNSYFEGVEINHFDFACGTGRILSYFGNSVKKSTGCDISPSMLEVASENNKLAQIIQADLTKNNVLNNEKFNLITAFRFFPNAEKELRMDAMQVISRHLDDNGYLIFNNHKNTDSTRNRLARLFGRVNFQGMSNVEVDVLLKENNLEVVETFSLCIFPSSEKKSLLPIWLLQLVEQTLSYFSLFKNYGENIVYLCRRST